MSGNPIGLTRRLYKAISKGDISAVEELVESENVKLDIESGGETPLTLALENGHTDLAIYLIEHGANVDKKNSAGSFPIHMAIKSLSKELVDLMIKKNVDLNVTDFFGDSPLDCAYLYNGDITLIKTLIDSDAEITKNTLEHVLGGDYADKSVSEISGYVGISGLSTVATYIYYRSLKGDQNLFVQNYASEIIAKADLLRHLFDLDLNPNLPIKLYGRDSSLLFLAMQNGYLKSVSVLITNGANLDKPINGVLPLESAISLAMSHRERGLYWRIVHLLVKAGAKVTKLQRPVDLLINRVQKGDDVMVRGLLSSQIEINPCHYGIGTNTTPFHEAIKIGNMEYVQLMFSKGVKPDCKNREGKTTQMVAVENNRLEILKFLYSRKKGILSPRLLGKAIEKGHSDIVDWLLDKVDKNKAEEEGDFPVHFAMPSCKLDLVEKLFVDKALNAKNSKGSTLLHLAVINSCLDIVRWLLDKGADPNIKDQQGQTPIFYALKQLKGESKDGPKGISLSFIVEVLFGHGINLNVKNKQDETPLSLAFNVDIDLGEEWYSVAVKKDDYVPPLSSLNDVSDKEDLKWILENVKGVTLEQYMKKIKNSSRFIELLGILFKDKDKGSVKKILTQDLLILITDKIVDSNGNNVLHVVATEGNLQAVKLLLKHNPQLANAKNKLGQLPYQIAESMRDKEITQYFLQKAIYQKVDSLFDWKTVEECSGSPLMDALDWKNLLEEYKIGKDKLCEKIIQALTKDGEEFRTLLDELYECDGIWDCNAGGEYIFDQDADPQLVVDQCGHVFHKKCLDDFLEIKDVCPTTGSKYEMKWT